MKEPEGSASDHIAFAGSATQRVEIGKHVLHIEQTSSGGLLRLVGADGSKPLEIELTPNGPVLRLGAPLAIAVDGGLEIDADAIAIRSRSDLSLTSEGKLTIHAKGALQSEGLTQDIRATLGGVTITANDDVAVDGERILLNCS